MTLEGALDKLVKKGVLQPVGPTPDQEVKGINWNAAYYYKFHQGRGHNTNKCMRLRNEIQDLIENGTVILPEKPNNTTNPLDSHGPIILMISTQDITFDPSSLITPIGLPIPEPMAGINSFQSQ